MLAHRPEGASDSRYIGKAGSSNRLLVQNNWLYKNISSKLIDKDKAKRIILM
jgi:hypothetical protein